MRHPGKYILAIILLALFTVLSVQSLYETGQNSFWDPMEMGDETFRAKFFSEELEKEDLSGECKALLRQVAGEIQYFPVPDSVLDPKLTTSYVNTWMAERSYGGKRGHEGIDIMADVQRPGLYPVVSMTDGVVTNLGWLEQGGYRIGITGDGDTYYYYAHLDSYGQVGKGDRVRAGELLGYMGDSGYGPEGTRGKFDVHLHVGIYVYQDGAEISLNPYYVLQALEDRRLRYEYS